MATASTIINRGMRLLGLLGSGESATTDETADGLISLNAMIDAWNNERGMIYAIQDESLTLVASKGSYTIGPLGDLATTRPVEIIQAFVRSNGFDYPVRILEDDEYNAIVAKGSLSTWPFACNYNPTMATGTLAVYPVPTVGSVMHLQTRTPFTAFSSASTSVSLPPGYEKALAYNLAIDFAPEFEKEPPVSVIRGAMTSLAGIRKINNRPIKAYTELAALVGGGRKSNIITGDQ